MALFPRRRLQQMLDENASFMRDDQIDEHIRRLNIVSDEYLSTEWETGLLNAFSKGGTVQHEPAIGGQRYLDLLFRSPDGTFEFAADIATVSDQQLHKRNPVYPLWDELRRQVRKRRVTTGGFVLAVGHHPESLKGRDIRHDLKLPPIGKFQEVVFNAGFHAFITEVKGSPTIPRDYSVQSGTTAVTIRYDPQQRGVACDSYLSYTCANVLDNNPVFNVLEKKSRQLKASNYPAPRGVIICDGGCRMLTTTMNNWAEYTLDQVVADFFRQHQSVAFVAVIGLRGDYSPFIGRGHYSHQLRLRINPRFRHIQAPLRLAMDKMIANLPAPETSGENALGRAKAHGTWSAFFGGLEMSGNKVKLSAGTILQLLAGKLDYATFARAHGFDQQPGNPFLRAVNEGRLIARCAVESVPDDDDDWITFEFGEPDPAVAPFRRRSRSSATNPDAPSA